MKKRLGEQKLKELEIRANTIGRKLDLEAIKICIETKLREVKK